MWLDEVIDDVMGEDEFAAATDFNLQSVAALSLLNDYHQPGQDHDGSTGAESDEAMESEDRLDSDTESLFEW